MFMGLRFSAWGLPLSVYSIAVLMINMASFVHSSIDSNMMSTLLLLLNSLSLFPKPLA
ncbi:hypothetical protein NC651_034026 [Populus alba x Populus x berolinensis]|nr:hypothetical protein NC651_034026 [Populus alba x Populus x berolinensis]